jgi:hypothetical protein
MSGSRLENQIRLFRESELGSIASALVDFLIENIWEMPVRKEHAFPRMLLACTRGEGADHHHRHQLCYPALQNGLFRDASERGPVKAEGVGLSNLDISITIN